MWWCHSDFIVALFSENAILILTVYFLMSCALILNILYSSNCISPPHGVVHGITASQLETRHTSNDSLNDTCLFGADGYSGVWINLGLVTTVASDCLVKGLV